MGLGEIRLGEMGLGEMGQNRRERQEHYDRLQVCNSNKTRLYEHAYI